MNLSVKPGRRRLLLILGICFVLAIISAVLIFLWEYFKVETYRVEGNYHYTDEEIIRMIRDSPLADNSLYLWLKYRDKEVRNIPFIEKMVISIVSPEEVKITVYEKSLAGFVQYLDNYMYFDKDGIVVECSVIKTAGVPQVTGLSFDHVILYEPLPVERKEVFAKILDATQMLDKYALSATKIHFDDNYAMSIYFDGVRVDLGEDQNVDEKLILLRNILPELEGRKGRLDLSEYAGDEHSVTFGPDE